MISKELSSKHRAVLRAVFERPDRADVEWRDIESLFLACGADVEEGSGSRVRIAVNGVRSVFHRPHPQKETEKGALRSARRLLREAGIEP